jgi:hypothetical protein
MARYGEWKPVDRYQSGSLKVAMTPRRLVLHTAVSSSQDMHSFFNTAGNATPHFYVNEHGDVHQYIDTDFRSSANLEGNHDCITVESWDGYPQAFKNGQPPAWTDEQVEALAHLAAWCHKTHGIPLRRLPSSLPGTSGVGWHRQGIDGNFPKGLLAGRVPNGEHWSYSAGKVCPGDAKIHGTVDLIIPRAIEISNGDDMSTEDVKNIRDDIAGLKQRINEIATAERARDKRVVDRVIAAVKAVPAGPEGSVDVGAVETAIRNVFGALATEETS